MSILDEILVSKRAEVARRKRALGEREMARRARAHSEPTRGFARALRAAPAPAVIAEIKRRSPSRGEIRPDFDALECARCYAEAGAAALSVLTDERYFGGRLEYLAEIRARESLPLLRKDFVIDPYQIDEARVAGADAVLLIAAALPDAELEACIERARGHGLDALLEVHDEAEMQRALRVRAQLIGVNHRDLHSFEIDLGLTERLAARLDAAADVVLVAESGIVSAQDVSRLERAGADAFLVGESLMREADPGLALRRLRRFQ